MTYNLQGKRITSENLAGQVTTTAWEQFACAPVGELVSAAKSAKHACDFDDIGNRESSSERGTNSVCAANQLNQYTEISSSALSASPRETFTPQFDDDGNQTLIKTSTGIWSVTYNGENRPVSWTCGTTNIVMKFDRMGRRVECLETVDNGDSTVTTNAHHRFAYDGYLCIQRLDGAANNAVDLAFGWDPTEPAATRPLVMQRNGGWNFFYTHDGNKNVSDVVSFQQARGVPAHYEYAPFGAVTAVVTNNAITAFNVAATNPFRFSSEYADDTLGLVYYNYRHYDPMTGRWVCRDLLSGLNDMLYLTNTPVAEMDILGLLAYGDTIEIRDGFFDFGKPDIGYIKVEGYSWDSFNEEADLRHQAGLFLSFTPGESFTRKCCKDDLRWIQWILSDTDVDPSIPADTKYPKLDVLGNTNNVYYVMSNKQDAAVKWNPDGKFLFSDTPTAYKRKTIGETRTKFKTCLVCDKTKEGCDGAKPPIKIERNVCFIELKCIEWEIVYGVRIGANGKMEEYFEVH